jgi:uncharacterized coiled-coil DUF342 family protein
MGELTEYLENIRELEQEIKEIHQMMKDNPRNANTYMQQLDEIDKQIIYYMDKFREDLDGDTSTK